MRCILKEIGTISVWDETEVDRTSYCIREPLAVEFCSRVILLILYKRGMKDSCSPYINY